MRIAILVLLVAACQSSPVSRTIGARCEHSANCDDRCLPDAAGYPGGFCTVVCNESSECPSDSACVDDEGGACLFECLDDDSCAFLGTGWTCRERDVRGQPDHKVTVCRGD